MSRRIFTAIVAVTIIAVTGFSIPLGFAVRRLYHDEAIVRLEREAAQAGAQIPASFRTSGDPAELPRPTDGTRLAVYDPSGTRLLGDGPTQGDAEVAQASAGRIADGTHNGLVVVAAPLTSEEQVFAVIRAALPESSVARRARRAWLTMAALGVLVVATASVLARAMARRLSRPVAGLASAARHLGGGDFTARAGRSGIPELDDAAASLDTAAERLGRLVNRERSFSADASHQLRTPLTGLRLHLETALISPEGNRDEAITVALGEVDRLERTIDDLLALARDVPRGAGSVDLRRLLDDLDRAWHGPLAAAGRPLRTVVDADVPPIHASSAAIRQILEVLVGNAAEHGQGAVRVHARRAPGGIAVEVTDEGPGIRGDHDRVFERRVGTHPGHGIGLALARSLAEAEGGRLLLAQASPSPTFNLLLPLADSTGRATTFPRVRRRGATPEE